MPPEESPPKSCRPPRLKKKACYAIHGARRMISEVTPEDSMVNTPDGAPTLSIKEQRTICCKCEGHAKELSIEEDDNGSNRSSRRETSKAYNAKAYQCQDGCMQHGTERHSDPLAWKRPRTATWSPGGADRGGIYDGDPQNQRAQSKGYNQAMSSKWQCRCRNGEPQNSSMEMQPAIVASKGKQHKKERQWRKHECSMQERCRRERVGKKAGGEKISTSLHLDQGGSVKAYIASIGIETQPGYRMSSGRLTRMATTWWWRRST